MTARRLLTGGLVGAVLAAGVAGCGGDGEEKRTPDAEASASAQRTETVRTRVEVVEQSGRGGAFDAQRIYRTRAPGVVTVISEFGKGEDLLDELGGGEGRGLGSGFVISAGGEIATNAHVVTAGEGSRRRRAKSVFVQFGDGNQVPARVVGDDPNSDVALLKVNPAGLSLRPVPLGSNAKLKVGAPVAAIGSPFGERQSLSVGVVSALDRAIDSLTNFQISGAIQTDAAINQGNSGGPLLNAEGEVLGINSQIRSSGGGSVGVGFAVPVDIVRRSLDQLRRKGKVSYAYVGISSVPVYPQLAEHFDLPAEGGAWIQEITPDAPADDAGLKEGSRREVFQAQPYEVGGDIVVEVAGKPVRQEADLGRIIARLDPGRRVPMVVYRGRDRRTVQVTLDDRPAELPSGRRRP